MKVVVLAAGKGKRMLPLTDSMPKALVPLKGKPLIQRSLEGFADAGASEIALVIGYMGGDIRTFFRKAFQGIPIVYIEQEEQLGTGHGFGLARDFCAGENFLASYCDLVFEGGFIENFFEFAEKNSARFDAVVAVRKTGDVSKFGFVEAEGNVVKNLVEKPKEKKTGLINAGLYWFSGKIFDAIEKTQPSERGEIEITDSIKGFMKKGRLGCFEVRGKCLDIGTMEELKEAEKHVD
ncbi:MAG: sugar phosphate nucleotidyltransferase [Candidatus ainarchaeum sp.]|nr:sugar phosphate nucleotidyltransferase [Candidatus ainarchaeum sp.]